MKKSIIYIGLFMLITLGACQKMEDVYLSGTVFINDPYFPGLPIYSEWGYNTFGAYIDRKPFVANPSDLPVKLIANNDTLHMIFRGNMGNQKVDLTFSIKGPEPQSHEDLTALNQTTYNLKDAGRKVKLKIDSKTYDLVIIEGEFVFNRIQRLYVDEEMSRSIMSGYFRFKTFLDGEPVSISNGRYDFGIGYENFYRY